MKAVALVVCLCVFAAATALAAPTAKRTTRLDPTLSPHVRAAEDAWTTAEQETDRALQGARWEAAAAAFALVDDAPVTIDVKREAAHAAVLAWRNAYATSAPSAWFDGKDSRNAVPKPRPLPEREQRIIAAVERYLRYAPAAADVPEALSIKARAYLAFDHLESAVTIYRDIIARFPQHGVAIYAAHLALDAYNRLQQPDKLLAFADELAKPGAPTDDDLAQTIKLIRKQAQRRAADALANDARTSKELAAFTAAGDAYLAIYNADREDARNDEVLYNAAVAYEQGASVGAALQAYQLIRRHYPNGMLGRRALVRMGKLYGDIVMYERAAETLEKYAKSFPTETDSFDAMSDAIFYWRAVNQRDKAVAGTKYLVATYGTKRRAEVAHAVWALTPYYASQPDALVKHLRAYIHVHGAHGGPERLVIAHAMIGLSLFEQSCKVRGVHGLCVKAATTPRTCGTGTAQTLSVVARDKRLLVQALQSMSHAAKELANVKLDPPQARPPGTLYWATSGSKPRDALHYYALAKLAEADLALERSLARSLPRALDVTVDKGRKRFEVWFEDAQKDAAYALSKYDAVVALDDPATAATAAQRRALLLQSFATTLVTGDRPRGASCETLTRAAAPIAATALDAYGVCLARSRDWYDPVASAHCEHELTHSTPSDYPPSRELRGRSLHTQAVTVSERPLLEHEAIRPRPMPATDRTP